MTETGIFTMSHQVDSTETDMFSRMRLSAFFRLLQKVSVLHCEALGAGRAVTLDRGILWVVTMHHGEFTRMPDYEEKVIIETWPGKTMYSLFPRYYRMTDMGGRELAKVSSIWTHVDMKTREVVPPAESGISIDQVVTGKEVPLPAVPVSIPSESTVIYKVPYSNIDLNQHMNNSCYYDLAENEFRCKCQYNFVQKVENNFVQFQFFSGWFSRNARLSFSLYDGPFMEITDE